MTALLSKSVADDFKLDRYSDGRLIVNVVVGGDPVELAGEGVFLSKDDR